MTIRQNGLVFLGIAAVSIILFIALAPSLAINVDEVPYLQAGRIYLKALFGTAGPVDEPASSSSAAQATKIEDAFLVNHEHPPVAKYLYGLFGLLFERWLGPITSSRLGGLFFLLLLQGVLFFFVSDRYGPWAGAVAALSVIASPRLLYHAFSCGLDMPVTALSVLCVWLFIQGLHYRKMAILCGIVWGLALATKNNAVFLIVPLMLWGYVFHRRQIVDNLFFLILLGPLTFVAVWPHLWHDTLARLIEYFQFHAQHIHEPIYFYGAVYTTHPHAYAPATVLAVTPLALIALSLAALPRLWKKPIDDLLILIFWLVIFPVILFLPQSVPIYNDERFLLLSLVMIGVAAGIGLTHIHRAWLALAEKGKQAFPFRFLPRSRRFSAIVLTLLVLLPGLCSLLILHPYESGYYGGLVGFRAGALRWGFNPMPWAQVPPNVVEDLARQLPSGATLNANSGAATVLADLQRLGAFRPDVAIVPEGEYWLLEMNFAYSAFPRFWVLYYDLDQEYRRVRDFPEHADPRLVLYRKLP